jgi:hypothetical protein
MLPTLTLAALAVFAMSGCTAAPTSSADRAGARVGQLTAALAANTQGVWQELVVTPIGCELPDDTQGVSWVVNAIQRESVYPFNRNDESADELAQSLAQHFGEYGYQTVGIAEPQVGDQVQITINGHSPDSDRELIEFTYSFYPDDEVSALIEIRTQCLPGSPDDYPSP